MLGRKNYTQEEIDHATAAANQQLTAYRTLVAALDGAASDPTIKSALDALEPLLFNNMVLVLDRYFVHRLRGVTGKEGNPINEVELLAESLMNNDGVFRGINVIKYVPEESVLEMKVGDRIEMTADQFERLAAAFLTAMGEKFG